MLVQLSKAGEEHKPLLGHLLWVAQHVAKQEKLAEGFRVVINDGRNGCKLRNGHNLGKGGKLALLLGNAQGTGCRVDCCLPVGVPTPAKVSYKGVPVGVPTPAKISDWKC